MRPLTTVLYHSGCTADVFLRDASQHGRRLCCGSQPSWSVFSLYDITRNLPSATPEGERKAWLGLTTRASDVLARFFTDAFMRFTED